MLSSVERIKMLDNRHIAAKTEMRRLQKQLHRTEKVFAQKKRRILSAIHLLQKICPHISHISDAYNSHCRLCGVQLD